ncbi:hypothetical protein GBA65_04100 [Rubrobacter marinus]|uniref:DUF5343 domain-containing protein n=1 Tax=Rubrobacter marinus TaxID=2653852 RepID=A0A6G8PUD5_9ACTN|nr:DUF5343 domain-containing protein [Rubrobacter marinus]QIN77837.1 hypothetical protein GBA65_04100 [Rubrobacter marinus]
MEEANQRMPYAPASGVLTVVRRYRERGLPLPMNNKALQQVGVSEGNAPRTLQALKILGLIDEEGGVTDAFKRVQRANTAEYPATLAEIVRSAYHTIFTIVDPAQDDLTAVNDAFRWYEPSGQRQRMVKLFLSLCDEAGLIPEENREALQMTQQQGTRRRQPPRRSSGQQRAQKNPQPKKASTPPDPTPADEELPRREAESGTPDYRPITVLIQQLPKGGRWTKRRRDLWVRAMVATVDLAVEIEEPEEVLDGEVMPEDDQLELESY